MPELPEVETIKNQLDSLIVGKIVKNITILSPSSFIGDPQKILGKKVISLHRYAKLLVIKLDGINLGIHLKMTGQLLIGKNADGLSHKRVIITFTNNEILTFNDIRKFGWIKVLEDKELENYKRKLGPDPFDISQSQFFKLLTASNKPIKTFLMDQEKIGGVGNIYANEALFLSKVNPKSKASSLTHERSDKLLKALIQVLKMGVKYRGASRTNYRDVYGKKGSVQNHFLVYDQEGKLCPNNCGEKIKRIVFGGRSSFYCPRCQK